MAFLRKKNKPETPTKSPTKVTLASSTSPPPLFARFATTAPTNNAKDATPRIVSSPMMLSGQRKDRELPQRVASGKGFGHSTTSLATSNRDPHFSHRKMQESNQSSVVPINGSVYDSGPTSQQWPKSPTRPASRVVVEKPLPRPSSAIITEHRANSLDTVNRRTTVTRGPGPPPTSQNPQAHVVRSRASLDMRDLESKPLPRPGSAQASFQTAQGQDSGGPPPSNYKFTPTTTPRRNASFSTASTTITPQIGPPITSVNHKIQPSSFPYGRQPPSTTDQNFASQTLSPHLSKRPVIGEDFPQGRANGIEGVPSKRMSSVGPPQSRPQDAQGTPMSDRGIDLPPEVALFQEFSDAISIPGTPNASNIRRLPPSSIKSTEQVPTSSIPRSSVYMESETKAQPSIPRPGSNKPQPPSPPLPPPPPPPPDMGITSSRALGSDVLSSSYKDFSAPRIMAVTDGPPSMNNNMSNINPRRQHQLHNTRSTSPPLPPGAAQPANYQILPNKHQNIGSMRAQPPNFYPPPLSQSPMTQPINPVSLQQLTPVMLHKSPSMQAASTPLRGKPRIFAAMEAQETDADQNQVDQAPMPPPHIAQYPPQQPHFVQSNRPPVNQYFQPHQHQPQPQLLPPVEFPFPKPQPAFFPNQYTSGVDPRSVPASITPPSPKAPHLDHAARQPDLAASQESDPPFRTPKSNRSASLPRQQEEPRQQLQSPQATPRVKKLSKTRHHVDNASISTLSNGSNATVQSSPENTRARSQRSASKSRPTTPMTTNKLLQSEPIVQIEPEAVGEIGIPLDDDPFARVEGVKMLANPPAPVPTKERSSSRHRGKGSVKGPSESSDSVAKDIIGKEEVNGSPDDSAQVARPENHTATPLTPVSPEDLRKSKKEKKSKKTTDAPPTFVESITAMDKPPAEPVTMVQILSDPQLLSSILSYLSFYDWCLLSSISKEIRVLLVRTPTLRETVLETYLKTVGYCRWAWDDQEPLSLSLQDLNDYMRGVSIPSHEYARVAAMHVHSLSIHPNHRDPSLVDTVRALTACTRSYSRVLLRLRAQAEKEASMQALNLPQPPPSATSSKSVAYPSRGPTSRVSSRAPSPTMSTNSYSVGGPHPPSSVAPTSSQTSLTFRSPLFRLRRAPLLRVFVPSPEGDWLSDKSVLECEAECKRAGIMHLLRLGDVVWDVAVGDEGNVGRLVWDSSYLIDLDYTYSPVGDLPKYLPTLAFPPSYFHRVIRTGPNVSNPIIHIDISPWGEEIAMNLQLLQDRVRTETPQGAYHNVVRWVHRSSFSVRPPRGPNRYNKGAPFNGRIPIPDSTNLFVDSGWYGTIVVETEGTNEALADLQDRCGPGAFPPRPRGVTGQINQAQIENRKVFRILREKSRPGEIWIRAVGVKERLI